MLLNLAAALMPLQFRYGQLKATYFLIYKFTWSCHLQYLKCIYLHLPKSEKQYLKLEKWFTFVMQQEF